MRIKTIFALLFAGLCLSMLSAGQAANIYMDEDFEGATSFQDRDFSVRDDTVTPPSEALHGINLRAYSDAYLAPKVAVTNSAATTTTRHFLGAKCLQLSSGQMAKSVGPYVSGGGGEGRLFQFALSSNQATAALTPGTKVGHFKFDWSVITTNQVEASLVLNVVVNSQNKLDVICPNNGATIGTFAGGTGNWLLISLLTNSRAFPTDSAQLPGGNYNTIWRGDWDVTTNQYKGPLPPNPTAPPVDGEATNATSIGSGVQIYVNDIHTTVTTVRPEQVGPGWGNDNDSADLGGSAAGHNSCEMGWEIAAENGGTLFVDDMYWDIGGHGDPYSNAGDATLPSYLTQEQGVRIDPYNQLTNEPQAPPEAYSRTWDLY